jgi:3'-phosphoadenosine 5'-phosphosulfate sulfotransferase (PAPS reductase)/FAD synthetase
MSTIVVPKEIEGLPIIASVSGGKDSTALVLALREAGLDFRMVFADTGWEAPETYDYVEMLRQKVGPIDVVGAPGGMEERARHRAGFPARMQRWCTRELKIKPIQDYHRAAGDDAVSAVGVRADESESRSRMPELEDSHEWGGYVWRPLIRWTIEDVILILRRNGVPMNALYHRGHSRVGCFPCIFSTKEEIRLISEHSPETIDRIRRLEAETTEIRAQRNAEKPGRYAHNESTFFQTRVPGLIMGIDDIVAWSKTSRGGHQLPLLQEPPSGGCFRWGLCESPTKKTEESE